MSRAYSMYITIYDYDEKKEEAVIAAVEDIWNIDTITHGNQGDIVLSGESYLTGGEDEEEFVDRLAEKIWKANGNLCLIDVEATCLEDLPFEEYQRGEEEYEQFIERTGQCLKNPKKT